MNKETKQLKELIKKSNNILILTHKGPDVDAFGSMMITYFALKNAYPKKTITMQSHKLPTINLPGMKEIEIVKKYEPGKEELIIVTDTPGIPGTEERIDKIHESKAPVVAIDHHDIEPSPNTITINENRSSATEQVIITMKEILGKKFKITSEIAKLGQNGIVSDTGRFLYSKTTGDTHRIFADLIDVEKVNLENMAYKQSKVPRESAPAIIEFLKTLTIVKDMSYMYIDNETIEKAGLTKQGVNEGKAFLRDRFLRNIQGVHWGFIISPGFEYDNDWFISFRSTKGYQSVKEIAEELGGGGHEFASGVPMTGNSLEEILEKVLEAVHKYANLPS